MVKHKVHETLNPDRVESAAVANDWTGFCIACGETQPCRIPPNEENWWCEFCGRDTVYGAAACLKLGLIGGGS